MGVVRTDQWLDSDFNEPLNICKEFMGKFGEDQPDAVYQYLLFFGMYKPNRQSFAVFEEMKKEESWNVVDELFKSYLKKWNGPDIPIYLFPIHSRGLLAKGGETEKSGVSFKDKIFLFIKPFKDEKEIESIIVHEYHHVCRLNKQEKRITDYTLLDSIIMEGLAENAVEETCGRKYLSKWSTHYSNKELATIWERYIKKNLDCKKESNTHDDILFGKKGYPPMIGYAAGYDRVLQYKKKRKLSIADSFHLPAKEFIAD